MTFEIVFDSAREFESLIATLEKFFDEAVFQVNMEGIQMRAIDPSRVVLVDLNLPEMLFSKYSVESEEAIAFDLKRFLKVLKLARSRDTLVLRKGGENFLEVGLLGDENTWFKLPLIDANTPEIEIPSLPWTVKAVVLAGALKRAVKAAKLVSDSIYFMATPEKLTFKAEGNDSEVRTVLTMEDPGLLDLEHKMTKAKSAYGVAYLEDILRSLADADEVIIRFGFDIPLLLKYMVRDAGEVSFLIAPRVEEGRSHHHHHH
nr:Chain A, DNA polymerase sliding clamp 2 [Thermococcus kodakarensis]3LX2_B Chain B, DNA polymerase sliding clamp 2 [Thermococcus kodakarensis]3LX2_C Chain C, DNA polymerase sliding clamp 2 [Thermococcus kodakarensis]